jgi:hypothetical protein
LEIPRTFPRQSRTLSSFFQMRIQDFNIGISNAWENKTRNACFSDLKCC